MGCDDILSFGMSVNIVADQSYHLINVTNYIVARMRRLYKTGIGLTTGFIGSQYSYSVLHFTTQYSSCNSSGIPCHHLLTLSSIGLQP
jgi:hypothetical protein